MTTQNHRGDKMERNETITKVEEKVVAEQYVHAESQIRKWQESRESVKKNNVRGRRGRCKELWKCGWKRKEGEICESAEKYDHAESQIERWNAKSYSTFSCVLSHLSKESNYPTSSGNLGKRGFLSSTNDCKKWSGGGCGPPLWVETVVLQPMHWFLHGRDGTDRVKLRITPPGYTNWPTRWGDRLFIYEEIWMFGALCSYWCDVGFTCSLFGF